jgi:6-phosphogluconate dehydrogenase
MQLGMIGLGRMGASLVRRLTKDGRQCVVYDVNPAAVKKIASRGVRGAVSIDDLVAEMASPRAVWVMVPAGVAGKTVEELAARYERFGSRGGADFANRVLSAMRKEFGGHDEKNKGRS